MVGHLDSSLSLNKHACVFKVKFNLTWLIILNKNSYFKFVDLNVWDEE